MVEEACQCNQDNLRS